MLKYFLILSSISFNTFAFNYSLSGFVGYTFFNSSQKTDYNKSPYDFGLIFSTSLTDNIETNILLNYTGEETPENIISFGFLSYHDTIFGLPYEIQGGKFKYNYGLHGGDLVNPRSRAELISPESIYWHPMKFTLLSAYGFRFMTEINNFTFSSSIGSSSSNNESEEFFSWLNIPDYMVPGDTNMSGYFGNTAYTYISYSDDINLVKLGYGYIDNNDYIKASYITAGYQFNYDKFSIELESLFVRPNAESIYASFFNYDTLSKGYSITVGYNISYDIKLYANFNTYNSVQKSPFPVDKYRMLYQDISVGFLYDITDSLMLRAEIHKSSGSRVLPIVETLTSDKYDEYYTTAINLTYFF